MLCAMGEDRVERRDVDLGVRSDRVGASRVQLLERVGLASPVSITCRPESSMQITEM